MIKSESKLDAIGEAPAGAIGATRDDWTTAQLEEAAQMLGDRLRRVEAR